MGKTRRAFAMLLFMVVSLSVNAQVFILDYDENYREPEDPYVLFIKLPESYGLGVDWYTPVGDNLLLFTALGGAYLLIKRKRNNQTIIIKSKLNSNLYISK